jgi:hypothetical protein
VAGIASLWNWLGGDPEAAAGVTMSLGQKVGLFIDRALLWIGVAFAALILTWLAFPRSRALIWDMLSGLPKALYRACSGDRAGAAEAATNLVAAPLRLAGAVGEPVERRIRRDGSRILRQSRKSRSR